MLGKRTRPVVIGKLPTDSSFMSGGRTCYPEAITSPKCSLEFRILSPRSLMNSDPIRGVGLGIVAALEKSCSGDKTPIPTPTLTPSATSTRSTPIPIGATKYNQVSHKEHEESMEESYTYVTSHRQNCDKGAGHDRSELHLDDDDMRLKSSPGFFYESPPSRVYFPTLDFLSSCYLCRKNLHGVDIYMYRGDKAFCSSECRCRQIGMDERKEKCGSEVRSVDISSSPYSRDNIFFTGIIAT